MTTPLPATPSSQLPDAVQHSDVAEETPATVVTRPGVGRPRKQPLSGAAAASKAVKAAEVIPFFLGQGADALNYGHAAGPLPPGRPGERWEAEFVRRYFHFNQMTEENPVKPLSNTALGRMLGVNRTTIAAWRKDGQNDEQEPPVVAARPQDGQIAQRARRQPRAEGRKVNK